MGLDQADPPGAAASAAPANNSIPPRARIILFCNVIFMVIGANLFLAEVGLAAALEVGALVVRAVGVRGMHELLSLVLLAAAGPVEETRAGMALHAVAVALAAANPRRRRQALVRLAGLAVGLGGVERLVTVDGNRLFDEAFDGLQEAAFLGRDERDGRAALARAGRAADAVYVAFRLDGQLHVHDEVHAGDVDAA